MQINDPMFYVLCKSDGLEEWSIIELQGDLEVRGERIMSGQFIGDLCYDKYGQPILIIGHHILHGKEQKLEKPFAVLRKVQLKAPNIAGDDAATQASQLTSRLDDTNATMMGDSSQLDSSQLSRTVLDSTVAIEHKTRHTTEYLVQAIISKRLIFKSRPKPIIANVAKQV